MGLPCAEHGGVETMGSQGVRHNLVTERTHPVLWMLLLYRPDPLFRTKRLSPLAPGKVVGLSLGIAVRWKESPTPALGAARLP